MRRILDYLRVGAPDWAVRRRMAMGLQLLATWMIVYGAVWEVSEPVAQTLIMQGAILAGAVLTVYVAAVVVDDGKKRAAGMAQSDTVGG